MSFWEIVNKIRALPPSNRDIHDLTGHWKGTSKNVRPHGNPNGANEYELDFKLRIDFYTGRVDGDGIMTPTDVSDITPIPLKIIGSSGTQGHLTLRYERYTHGNAFYLGTCILENNLDNTIIEGRGVGISHVTKDKFILSHIEVKKQ